MMQRVVFYLFNLSVFASLRTKNAFRSGLNGFKPYQYK
jgi:hypothetical protein